MPRSQLDFKKKKFGTVSAFEFFRIVATARVERPRSSWPRISTRDSSSPGGSGDEWRREPGWCWAMILTLPRFQSRENILAKLPEP
jgi:hypothetical protein